MRKLVALVTVLLGLGSSLALAGKPADVYRSWGNQHAMGITHELTSRAGNKRVVFSSTQYRDGRTLLRFPGKVIRGKSWRLGNTQVGYEQTTMKSGEVSWGRTYQTKTPLLRVTGSATGKVATYEILAGTDLREANRALRSIARRTGAPAKMRGQRGEWIVARP